MMKLDDILPDSVVAIIATRQVEARDYATVLMPAVDSALKRRDRIRVHCPKFSFLMAGLVKILSNAELAEAREWISS